MKTLMFVWTFESIIAAILAAIAVLIVIGSVVRYWYNTTFKKNCHQCKHCKLDNVSSCGGPSCYKCTESGRYMYTDRTYDFFVRCKKFEKDE